MKKYRPNEKNVKMPADLLNRLPDDPTRAKNKNAHANNS